MLKSALIVLSGFARYARKLHDGQACILMFHGLREDGDPGLLDADLHTPRTLFYEICQHLATHFKVKPLSEVVRDLRIGGPVEESTVVLTFDDGYASNYELALPVLREFGLPAAIFPATSFLDKTETPWFIRLEYAVVRSPRLSVSLKLGQQKRNLNLQTYADRNASLGVLQSHLKAMPQDELSAFVGEVECELDARIEGANDVPDIFRPLTWDQAREMRDSGLVEFGGHTHRHLILSRCSEDVARYEIDTCRKRLEDKLDRAPDLFAYPNGQKNDHNSTTARLLSEAGFSAALTTSAGFVTSGSDLLALPRCGTPHSHFHVEATASGAFETLKKWRSEGAKIFARAAG